MLASTQERMDFRRQPKHRDPTPVSSQTTPSGAK